MAKSPKDDVTGVETTGHEWDGIKELNNPLPRWWLWTFYLTVLWGIGYTIAYPAWPMISGATAGFLGYSTRAEVAADIERFEARNADLTAALAGADLNTLSANEPLYRYAVAGGGAVFRTYCSQCHGSGAAGAKGYPNLLDDDWLWGGSIDDIAATIRHGVRAETDDDTRYSEMPAYGEFMEKADIDDVVQHVLALSGQEHDAAMAARGAVTFQDQCIACHGETGQGDREFGGPDLTDAIWLYGGDVEALTETVTNARFGVMPPWADKLTDAEINAVATFVHQLGGGE